MIRPKRGNQGWMLTFSVLFVMGVASVYYLEFYTDFIDIRGYFGTSEKETRHTVQSFIDVMIESVTATAIASNIAGKWTLETATSTTTSVSTQATWSTSRPRPTTVQTVKPSAIPTITPRNELVSIVTNGGNLRTEPKTTHDTVIGQVCPGDEVTLLEKDQIDSTAWYHVQLRRQSLDCDPNRVKVGTTGWISKSLLSKPSLSSIP